MFRTRLTSILKRLDSLKLQFDKMKKYEGQIGRYNMELIRPLYDLLRECQYHVMKCQDISKWQLYEKHQCLKELEELENRLVGYCSINLIAIIGIDMKEANAAIFEMKDEVSVEMNTDVPLKKIKDELFDGSDPVNIVESAARGGYGMNKLSDLDEQVTETENIKGLQDVVFNNNMQELLDLLEPAVMVESAASPEGYGKSTLASNEQVTAISYEYDVFLCFRGDDTRESFTSTLFYALSKVYKVKTFMDVIFRKGSKLEELLKMVEKSRMSIVVFSENFAESEWCLKELAKIFEENDRRGHEVVPVFYKVNPSELRHQDIGKTKVHMEKHHSKYGKDLDTVKSWSNAMKELGNSSGYTYWSGRGKQEIELAEEIAQEILNRLHG